MKKIRSKNFRIYRNTIIVFITICIGIGYACFNYYRQLQDTVKTESSEYMQEIAKQMGSNINKTINDNYAILGTISSVLNSSGMNSYANMQQIIAEHQSHWNYQKIMLIDEKGIAYDETGKTVALKNDTYLQDVIVSKKSAMSPSQVIDGNECIVFAIPLDKTAVDGRNMVALAGAYNLNTFDKILSMGAFDGRGYSHIIRTDGTIVIRSSSENSMQTGYNILQSLSTATISDNIKTDDIYKNISAGESGQIEFKTDNNHEYMTYTPLKTLGWSLLTFVPVSAVNQKSTILLNITVMMCAVITLVFSLLFAMILISYFKNKQKLEQIAYVDKVTGGNTINKFNEMASQALAAKSGQQYALIYSNVEKFKVLNEQLGRPVCDDMLKWIYTGIDAELDKNDECIGRLFADNFCILVRYTDEKNITTRFTHWQKNCLDLMEQNSASWIPPIVDFGVYVISNQSFSLEHMIDCAKLSLSEGSKEQHGKVRYAIYDEYVRKVLFREKHLEDVMESALSKREFVVYLQPKYNTQTEKIGGAEALVRWNSEAEGMIYPDEFIPLFEKNGFIIQLDMFVFEEVCKTIHRWLDANQTPVKISVNCSRVHLKNLKFLENYSKIAKKYNIPKNAIEIELTESTVFENVNTLTETIQQIHLAGFGCSMDDFGSGYSSLNLIQDIPVDTLKLDKIFFRTTARDIKRTESVVGSIISMSKALSMETVAEGVEERLHVDMLKRLHCDYIQGYYFAKPMPVDEFEEKAFGKTIDVKEE